jgi:hypothetical protein
MLIRTAIRDLPRVKQFKKGALPLPLQRRQDFEATARAGEVSGLAALSELDQQMVFLRKGQHRFTLSA